MRYSEETKIQTITRYQNGEAPKDLCAELDISRSTFFRWAKQYQLAVVRESRKNTMREYDELLRRVEKQANMIAILKNAPCLVSAPLKTRMEYLESIYGSYEVRTLCEAMDVEDVQRVDSQDLKAVREAFKHAREFDGLSVIVFCSPCQLLIRKKESPYVVSEDCRKCRSCINIGCPAMGADEEGRALINPTQCIGCGQCAQICPFDCIKSTAEGQE